MDLLTKLNDRNLSFTDRCILAASLLNPSKEQETWLFPRKNQFLFDWLTGSLLKLAKTDSPKPEIFLNRAVWELLGSFGNILMNGSKTETVSLKRPLSMITNDEEFFDCKKCFDSHSFVIKCPLLTIFQTCLLLLNNSVDSSVEADVERVDPKMICSVILNFVQQNRVSLPVSFTQVTEFIRSLVRSQSSLPSKSFLSVLRPTLAILSEIVLGGAANYKKTYPLLVKFSLESACSDEEGIWIDFLKKCLFPQEYIDELLTLLTAPAMLSLLNNGPNTLPVNESTFPKSLTFQKTLFIELANEVKAVESCPVVYEAFLRAVGPKINRETGFNFFTFLLRRTLILPPSKAMMFSQLAKLISILQARGNEIYQQRNDQIYRDQSAAIEAIFNSALQTEKTPFLLLLSLAKLNYYLVAERLDSIFSLVNLEESLSEDVIEFVVGMFQLAALANQLPVLLEIILKSKLPIQIVKDQKLQFALVKIFQTSLSPVSLHQIYLSLSENIETSDLCIVLLFPVIRSIIKVVDNVDSFDKDSYLTLQSRLFEMGGDSAFTLLTEIVRWSPGTFLLMQDLFNLRANVKIGYSNSLNLLCTLKCKDPKKISLKSQVIPDDYELLILKYLPIIAEDLSEKQLESFSVWLLSQEQVCLDTLKMIKFFEIREMQGPFLNQLVIFINENVGEKASFISEIISLLPCEYLSEEMTVKLIKSLWSLPSAVSSLLKSHRKDALTLKSLVKSDNLDAFVDYLFKCTEDDLISKCLQAEHSKELIGKIIVSLKSKDCIESVDFVAKMLKYSDFESKELVNFIEKSVINPISLLKTSSLLSVKLLDAIDIILEWIVDYKMELVAASILELPREHGSLEVLVRAQALRCKFPARTDLEFINESIEMASKLDENDSSVAVTFKKDLLSLVKELPTERVKAFLESLLINENPWRFALGLQASAQLLHATLHASTAFVLLTDNLNSIYDRALKFDQLPAFLSVLKSTIQLKKNVTWDSKGIADILGVLRRSRQARPESFEEIFVTLRLIVTLHLRQFRNLLPLLITNICESFSGLGSADESVSLGRIISELGSLKRGEIEPFALLPLLHTFIITKYPDASARKPIQMAMNNLMYHLSMRKQLLQLMSTALVVEHEHRLVLKAFIDEFNKFHKYSGKA